MVLREFTIIYIYLYIYIYIYKIEAFEAPTIFHVSTILKKKKKHKKKNFFETEKKKKKKSFPKPDKCETKKINK